MKHELNTCSKAWRHIFETRAYPQTCTQIQMLPPDRNEQGFSHLDPDISHQQFKRRRQFKDLVNGKSRKQSKVAKASRVARAVVLSGRGTIEDELQLENEVQAVDGYRFPEAGLEDDLEWMLAGSPVHDEDYWATQQSSKPAVASLTLPVRYISAAEGYGGSFQVHFVCLERRDVMPVAVVVFLAGLLTRKVMFACTSVHCKHSKGNVATFHGIDSMDNAVAPLCEHAQAIGEKILEVHGVALNHKNVKEQLFTALDVPGHDVMGIYIADTDFQGRGRPMLFVDDSYQMEQVFFWNGKLWCHDCRKGGRTPCRHVRHANEMVGLTSWTVVLRRMESEGAGKLEIDRNVNEARLMARQLAVEQEYKSQYLLSRQLVQFSNADYARAMEKRATGLLEWMAKSYKYSKTRDRYQVYPEPRRCISCEARLKYSSVSGQSYYCGQIMLPIEVYTGCCHSATCQKAGTVISYEGADDHMVNYGNRLLLPLELTEEYLRLYATSALSVSAWWEDKCNSYLRGNMLRGLSMSLEKLLSRRGQVSTAIAGTAELLDLARVYKCGCRTPTTISMDGIVLSTTRIAMPKYVKPWQLEGVEKSRATFAHERQLAPLQGSELKLLAEICNRSTGAALEGVKSAARHTRNAGLLVLLLLAIEKHDRDGKCCISSGLSGIASFLRASIAPVTSLIPYDYWSDVEAVSIGEQPSAAASMRELSVNATQMHKLCVELQKVSQDRRHPVWRAFKRFLGELMRCKKAIFAVDEESLYQELTEDEQKQLYATLPRKHPSQDDLSELWSTGSYFPGFPIVRRLKHVQINPNMARVCHKEQVMDAGCMPGVLLFYCVDHQCCIGFVVLDGGESPRVVYEVIMSRFKTLPQNVIYDNGCNLSQYILNRTPWIFRRTQVFVDAFHYHSHNNCASCFSTDQSPMLSEKWNTSLFEQRNARLTKLKETAPLMRSRVFMALLRVAVAKANYKYKFKEMRKQKHSLS